MPYVYNPKKDIVLSQGVWKNITDTPFPGIMVGYGNLSPAWVNARGHTESNPQPCIISHYPKDALPTDPSFYDNTLNEQAAAYFSTHLSGIMEILLPDAAKGMGAALTTLLLRGGLIGVIIDWFNQSPFKKFPIKSFLNVDGSLTIISAFWYEGSPRLLGYMWTNNDRFQHILRGMQQINDLELHTESKFHKINQNPQVSDYDINPDILDLARDLVFSSVNLPNIITFDKDKDNPVSLQGILEESYDVHKQKSSYYLKSNGSNHSIATVFSGEIKLEFLPELPSNSVVEVFGSLNNDSFNGYPGIAVDSISILQYGNVIQNPPIVLDKEFVDLWFADNKLQETKSPQCPPELSIKIKQLSQQIIKSSENLKKIEWKKFGAIGMTIVGLISVTISAAVGILASAAIPPTSLALAILTSKISALISGASQLSNLDSWAKAEINTLNASKTALESLKRQYPYCFK